MGLPTSMLRWMPIANQTALTAQTKAANLFTTMTDTQLNLRGLQSWRFTMVEIITARVEARSIPQPINLGVLSHESPTSRTMEITCDVILRLAVRSRTTVRLTMKICHHGTLLSVVPPHHFREKRLAIFSFPKQFRPLESRYRQELSMHGSQS